MISKEKCPYGNQCPVQSCIYQSGTISESRDPAQYKNCLIYNIAVKLGL